MSEEFLFSVPSGEPVEIEPFHYCIVGQTQFSGKTTLLKRLSEWAVDLGYKVLIFDTKETEADYAGFGQEVPVCLRETTDSFVLIGLLESMFRRRLTPYYATLSRLTEAAKGFDDIISRARDLEARTKSAWLKDACRVLYDLLERLKRETAKVETVPGLKLYSGINRMVINDFSLEAQQLIVKNCFEDLLRIYNQKTVAALDESFKFIPQGYSSPATRSVMKVMTQGAKTGLFGWISTQFLAATDKGPLKACAFKFLGTQDHITEVKHTMDLIPEIRGKFTSDDIMKLKLGHWILVRKRPPDVRIVYSLPLGASGHIGRKVAMGEMTPENVRDQFLKVKVMEDEEMYRKLYETEKSKREELEKEFAKQLERLSDLKVKEKIDESQGRLEKLVEEARETAYREALQKVEEIKKQWNIEEYQKTIMQLKDENAHLKQIIENRHKDYDKKLVELEAAQGILEKLRKAFSSLLLLPSTPTTGMPVVNVPSEIAVVTEQPALTVETLRKSLTLSQDDLAGRIAIVYTEGLLPEKAFTTTQLNTILESRFGTKEFPGHLAPACNKFVAWGYFEKIRSGTRWDYRVKMPPKQAKEKGLLKEAEA